MTVMDESIDQRAQETFFMKPDFPSVPFFIEDDNGEVDGPFSPNTWSSDPYNVYVTNTGGGRPVFLRVLDQQGNRIKSVDGEGTVWNYTLHPVGGGQEAPRGPETVSQEETPGEAEEQA